MLDANRGTMAKDDDFTVVITDSGIGGVGIAAELVRTLQTRGPYAKARVIFFNALFDAQSGYNVLTDMAQKTAIFDTALRGMLRFEPHVVLLGSNTLSVLYEHTAFSRLGLVPVKGLLDLGVQHILDSVKDDLNVAAVILFATPLTVKEGVFRARLAGHFAEGQVIEHACPGLEHAIGDGDTDTIHQLIDRYVEEALQRIPPGTQRVYASLHCTHFGYYSEAFLAALMRFNAAAPSVLNPNAELAHSLVSGWDQRTHPAQVGVRFVSKVHFNPQGMRSLQRYVTQISPETGRAFETYEHIPDLF